MRGPRAAHGWRLRGRLARGRPAAFACAQELRRVGLPASWTWRAAPDQLKQTAAAAPLRRAGRSRRARRRRRAAQGPRRRREEMSPPPITGRRRRPSGVDAMTLRETFRRAALGRRAAVRLAGWWRDAATTAGSSSSTCATAAVSSTHRRPHAPEAHAGRQVLSTCSLSAAWSWPARPRRSTNLADRRGGCGSPLEISTAPTPPFEIERLSRSMRTRRCVSGTATSTCRAPMLTTRAAQRRRQAARAYPT